MKNLLSDLGRLITGLHYGHKNHCDERRSDHIMNYCSKCGGRFVSLRRHVLIVIDPRKYADFEGDAK